MLAYIYNIYIYTQGIGTPTASQHNIFDSEKLSQIFLVLLTQTGVRTSGLWISSPTFYQLSHPITRYFIIIIITVADAEKKRWISGGGLRQPVSEMAEKAVLSNV